MSVPRNLRSFLIAVLVVFTLISWGHSLIIYSKAWLAQVLIERAWVATLEGKSSVKPWPWADTWPVAKVRINEDEKELYVLAGSHGSSLAFGPGHLDGTAMPGEDGTIVLSGHRDTHFRFLEHQNINDVISVQAKDGTWSHYIITDQLVRSVNDGPWHINNELDQLHLVTCYPFNSPLPGGDLRHITIAERQSDPREFNIENHSLLSG